MPPDTGGQTGMGVQVGDDENETVGVRDGEELMLEVDVPETVVLGVALFVPVTENDAVAEKRGVVEGVPVSVRVDKNEAVTVGEGLAAGDVSPAPRITLT